IFLLTASTFNAFAQDSLSVIRLQEMPLRVLEYRSPLQNLINSNFPVQQPAVQELDNFQKDIISRISDVYRIHVLSLEAQVNNDPIEAEKQINNALAATQSLLDDFPEIGSEARFA